MTPHPQSLRGQKLRLVLVDDHDLVREGLKRVIDTQDDMEVVGEANNGQDGIRLVASLRPAILLVDLSMPGMSGIDVARAVRTGVPEARIIGVTRHRDSHFVTAMFAAGAAGYVLKQSPSDELVRAIRAVAAGADFIDAALRQRNDLDARPADVETTEVEAMRPSLDNVEAAVLDMFASAYSDGEIAGRLSMETRDVHAARLDAMRKAGLRTRAQVVEYVRSRQRAPNPSKPE